MDRYYDGKRSRRKEISKKAAEKVGIGMICYKGMDYKLHKDYEGMTRVTLNAWEEMLYEKLDERNEISEQKRNNRLRNA